MSIRVARVLIVVAACLTWLGGCSSATKLSDLWTSKGSEASSGPATDAGETTGSVAVQPAEPGPSGEPVAPPAKPGLLGDDPHDDLQLAKKYFRSNNYGLAEKSFRSAVEKHPRDAEAWVGLAASYDRLHRFDLADRAYQEAIRIVGRRRKSSTTRDSPICCAAITPAPTRSSKRRRPRTPPTPTSRPIYACSKTATMKARRFSNAQPS